MDNNGNLSVTKFIELVKRLKKTTKLSRKKTYEVVKDTMPKNAGAFISAWPFSIEELEEASQNYWTHNGRFRLYLWNYLVAMFIINEDDSKELKIFRRLFYQISPTPRDLIIRIQQAKQTTPWKRNRSMENLRVVFRKDLIPGELEFQFWREWPEE